MDYLVQFLYILLFSFIGETLAYWIPLPIPGAIYGLVLLFAALALKILRLEKVKDASRFLLSVMPVLFVAPSVNILANWGLIAPNIAALLVIIILSTVLVFTVSGLVTKWTLRRKEQKTDGGIS